jgi:outer membrane protein assembly factor BamB
MGAALGRVSTRAWIVGGVALLLLVAVVLLLTGSSSAPPSFSTGVPVKLTGSGYPNANLANTRNAPSPIDSSNVEDLRVAWTLPIKGTSAYGSYASSPIISRGVVYSQDLASNVQAINQNNGKLLWTKSFELPDHGPNGVTVQDGRVLGATPVAAFALDQKTGKEIWSTKLVRNRSESIDMAPGYRKGIVYVSTVAVDASGTYGAGGVGVLWALDGKTGKKLWHFDTVPRSLWGNPAVNSGGGLWYSPAFDGKGSMYFGVSNPGPFPGSELSPWGSSRPGPNLYTSSVVKLDAQTGKLQWYYQVTPHAVYDWDFQNPPILIDAGGRQLVLGAGKSGFVIALDAKTGKPVWKRSVGEHNGHDNDGVHAMNGEFFKLKTPASVYPGALGGVIAPASTNDQTVFVPVINHPTEILSQYESEEPLEYSSELVALDVLTGKVEWEHEFSDQLTYGYTTVTNDLVFATTEEGTVYALDTKSGDVVWQDSLPVGTNAGVMVGGDTMIAPAGLAKAEGETPQIVAYRLSR